MAKSNVVKVELEGNSKYKILSAKYKVREYFVSPGKSSDIKTEYETQVNGSTISFDFAFDRNGTTDTANWFKQRIASNQNTFNHDPDKLNFAVIGDLEIKFAPNNSSYDIPTMILRGVAFAQGHSGTSNNWWFGSQQGEYTPIDMQMTGVLGNYDADAITVKAINFNKIFSFIFFRGQGGNNSVNSVALRIASDFPKDILTPFSTWMSRLSGEKYIDQLNIPGTHDSGTFRLTSLAETQTYSIREQLNMGIRFLDMRCKHTNDSLMIAHGVAPAFLVFGTVVEDCINFLKDNPKECIIMQVKDEDDFPSLIGNSRTYYKTFTSYVQKNPSSWYISDKMPQLKDVRGKIILVRRFNLDTTKGDPSTCGFDCRTKFPDNQTFELNLSNNVTINVQDQYNLAKKEDVSKKWQNIKAFLIKSKTKDMNKRQWFMNYSSAASDGLIAGISFSPWDIASNINPKLVQYLSGSSKDFVGTIIMDYPEYTSPFVVKQIIDKNF